MLNRAHLFGVLPLVTLAACQGSICEDVDVALDPDVVTKVDFSWDMEGEARIEWGYDESYGNTVDAGPGPDHEASILGAKPLSEIFFSVFNAKGNKEKVCEGVIETENTPSSIANIKLDSYDPSLASEEKFILGAAMFEDATLFAVDRDGDTVWYQPVDEDRLVTDVRFSRAGNSVLHNSYASRYDEDLGEIIELSLGNDLINSTRIEWGHHFFAELPDGTFAYTAIDVREVVPDGWSINACAKEHRGVNSDGEDTCMVVGHALIEVPPDGDPVTLTTTWDVFNYEVVPYDDWELGFYPQGHTWLHANALNYDDERQTYLWSFAGYDTFVEIDRSGNLVRSFGDFGEYKSELVEYPAGEDGFHFQHDPNWTEDGNLLMFVYDDDNGCYAIEFEVDESAKMLREVWSYGRNERLMVLALGTARRMANGNTSVNFGSTGVVREVTPSGEIAWEGYTDSGTFFGSTHWFSDFYTGQ